MFVEFGVIGFAFRIITVRMPPYHFGQALMIHDLCIDFPMWVKDITELVACNEVYIVSSQVVIRFSNETVYYNSKAVNIF